MLRHHSGWVGLVEKGRCFEEGASEVGRGQQGRDVKGWPQRQEEDSRELGLGSLGPGTALPFPWLTGREQASGPECLSPWTPQPAAARVPDSGAASSPLPAGLGLLCHLYLQHL